MIFSLILFHYSNHLQFKFDLNQKITLNEINWLNIANRSKNSPSSTMQCQMPYMWSVKSLEGGGGEKKNYVCRVCKKTLGKPYSLPSVHPSTRQTIGFAECPIKTLGKLVPLPSALYWHSANTNGRHGGAPPSARGSHVGVSLPSVKVCRVPPGCLPSVFWRALGKPVVRRVFYFCRVFLMLHSAKRSFAECPKKSTRRSNYTRRLYAFP